ncbi:MAG: DUF4974 domain-containing protein [Bacteroidales bacterium]|nr:DUF4974 domain-containing protein [Bacteroidales bacterium]
MNSNNFNEIQYSILKKYFEDSASEEEKSLVNSWLNNPKKALKYESRLRALWEETETDTREPAINLEMLLDRIHHKINISRKKENVKSCPNISKPVILFNFVLKNLSRAAAILLLPLMGYVAWQIYSQKLSSKHQAQAKIAYNEIICPLGARSQFELPDGTKGSLNNGSRLKYPVNFSGSTREVELVGEAFFDVHHDKDKPFIVKTAGLNVKVLGTRFNVYTYPGEGFQEFTLESGIIELIDKENNKEINVAQLKSGLHAIYQIKDVNSQIESGRTTEVAVVLEDKKKFSEFLSEMKPGQCAVYNMKKGNLNIKFDEPDFYTAWKEGKLVLRNDPMPRLLKRIERWYNVKFNILDDSINEYTYWATFEEESLDQVLKLLSLTGPIKFVKQPREKMDDFAYKVQEIDVMSKK